MALLWPIRAFRVCSGHEIKHHARPKKSHILHPSLLLPLFLHPLDVLPSLHCERTDLSALFFWAGRFDRGERRNGWTEGWSKTGKDETKVACLSFLCMCSHAFDRACTRVIWLKGVRVETEEDNDDRRRIRKKNESEAKE